jgi:hypothetical protein
LSSKKLLNSREVDLDSYWGGNEFGTCYQITSYESPQREAPQEEKYIRLTTSQLQEVVIAYLKSEGLNDVIVSLQSSLQVLRVENKLDGGSNGRQ